MTKLTAYLTHKAEKEKAKEKVKGTKQLNKQEITSITQNKIKEKTSLRDTHHFDLSWL